jgi:nicotinamide-nucleotide amidase
MDNEIFQLAQELGIFLKQRNWKIATAESCTGGGIAKAITDVPGSSQWFDRGFVTYSNQAKIDMLGVKPDTLEHFGAVSAETAIEMAEGCLQYSEADVTIAVTGIAGPEGGTHNKPVGTVYIALAVKNRNSEHYKNPFSGDRILIRKLAIDSAMGLVLHLPSIK